MMFGTEGKLGPFFVTGLAVVAGGGGKTGTAVLWGGVLCVRWGNKTVGPEFFVATCRGWRNRDEYSLLEA